MRSVRFVNGMYDRIDFPAPTKISECSRQQLLLCPWSQRKDPGWLRHSWNFECRKIHVPVVFVRMERRKLWSASGSMVGGHNQSMISRVFCSRLSGPSTQACTQLMYLCVIHSVLNMPNSTWHLMKSCSSIYQKQLLGEHTSGQSAKPKLLWI